MATSAVIGSQSLFQIGDGASPEAWTTVGEVRGLEIGQENDLVEVTHLLSTAKEFIYGLPDGLEFSVSMNYLPANAQQVAMLAAQAAKTTKNFKLTINPAAGVKVFLFSALIKGWRLPISPNEEIQITFNLKISGAIT